MKKLIFITSTIFLLLCIPSNVLANPIITSDTKYFDISTGRYILTGNVYVETGSRIITADSAQVNIISLEVWGQGNVTVVQDDITFTGQKVYIVGQAKTAYIDGGVDLERTLLSIRADSVSYNWDTKIASFTGDISVNDNGNTYTSDTLQYDMIANKII